jgi:hypothetical protein
MNFADFMRVAAAVMYGGVAIWSVLLVARRRLHGLPKFAARLLGVNAGIWAVYLTYAAAAFWGANAHVSLTALTRGMHIYAAATSGLVLLMLARLEPEYCDGHQQLEAAIRKAVKAVSIDG